MSPNNTAQQQQMQGRMTLSKRPYLQKHQAQRFIFEYFNTVENAHLIIVPAREDLITATKISIGAQT
jgi:hypothetical protein